MFTMKEWETNECQSKPYELPRKEERKQEDHVQDGGTSLKGTALFWTIRQRVVVIPLPTFRDNLSVPSWPLKMRPICCPETSVRNHHHSLRNSPEERSSQLLRSEGLKSLRAEEDLNMMETKRRSSGMEEDCTGNDCSAAGASGGARVWGKEEDQSTFTKHMPTNIR
jgi:hypothetical protein